MINNKKKQTIALQFMREPLSNEQMAKGKTVTIRVPEDTFEEIKGVCSDLGDAYNFNQFVNQSLGAILEVIRHEGTDVPIPKFAVMARLMKNYDEDVFVAKAGRQGES